MSDSASVTTWIGLLKAGDTEAASRLWERYFHRLVQLARGRLRGLARGVADEEDVALSAFQSFFEAVSQGRFPRLDDRDDLWQLLVMHTARKAIDERRRQQRQKRGGRTVTVDGPAAEIALQEVIGSEPDPQFAALVLEECQLLLGRLDDDLQAVAVRRMEGYSNEEIAAQLRVSLRTVERKLSIIRSLWSEASTL